MTTELVEVDADLRLLRCQPGEFKSPPPFDIDWPFAIAVETWGTIGQAINGSDLDLLDMRSLDDFDWWLLARTDFERAATVDFTGLSYPAKIFIDGYETVAAESMFLPVRCHVASGTSNIAIRFESMSAWLSRRRPRGRWRSTLVADQGLRWARTSLLGRAPVYGGIPPIVGVWRPVVTHSDRWIDDLRVEPNAYSGEIEITGTLASTGGALSNSASVFIEVFDPNGAIVARAEPPLRMDESGAIRFHHCAQVAHPELWWPNGYGDQNLYRLDIRSGSAFVSRVIGFRTVTADRSRGGFRILVNNIPIFCRGTVWVPPDPVAVTSSAVELAAQLIALRNMGSTMVRVFGGSIYEQADFYRVCSELGLLVWQDAMLATFDPPTDLDDIVCAELSHLLDSISGSPALAVVSGGSETVQQAEMSGADQHRRSVPLVTDRLAEVTSEHADVPYVASSPSAAPSSEDAVSPRFAECHRNQLAIRPDQSVSHWFGVGGYMRPLADVRSAGVRFAAETLAFAIPPADDAIESNFGSLRVVGHDPAWKAGVPRDRTAAWDFEDVRDFYVREVFGVDPVQVRRENPSRYLQLGRLAIAEAMAQCYTFWRGDEDCAGALVLSTRDLRVGAGWGLFDNEGVPKLPVAVLNRQWASRALLISNSGLAGIRIDIHNDSEHALEGRLRMVAVDALGNRVLDDEAGVTVASHASLTLSDGQILGRFADLSHAYRFGTPTAEAVEVTVECNDGRLLRDVLVLYPPASPVVAGLSAELRTTSDPEKFTVKVCASRSVRYVTFEISGWVPSDDCFALAANVPYVVQLNLDPRDSGAPPTPRGLLASVDAHDTTAVAVVGTR